MCMGCIVQAWGPKLEREVRSESPRGILRGGLFGMPICAKLSSSAISFGQPLHICFDTGMFVSILMSILMSSTVLVAATNDMKVSTMAIIIILVVYEILRLKLRE